MNPQFINDLNDAIFYVAMIYVGVRYAPDILAIVAAVAKAAIGA